MGSRIGRFLDFFSNLEMADITPSLADSHCIRTYPKDYAQSDTYCILGAI
jgi:hypothetical protein